MSGCNTVGKAEIARRKTVSDEINNTEYLVFHDSATFNSRAGVYRATRDLKDWLEIRALEKQTDEDYLWELLDE